MELRILHRIPGRLRLRIERLKSDEAFRDRLYCLLKDKEAVKSVRIAVSCASLRLEFDEAEFDALAFLQALSQNEVMLTDLPLGKEVKPVLRRSLVYKLANSLEFPSSLQLALAAAALASCFFPLGLTGRALLGLATLPVLARGIRTLYEDGKPGADLLDAGSVTLLNLRAAQGPGAIMLFLIALSEFIRDHAAERSSSMLKELLSLSQRSAWLVSGEEKKQIAADKLKAGDIIVVYTGESAAAEGIVESGHATVISAGQSAEKLPAEMEAGSRVGQDSIVLDGKLYLRCLGPRVVPAEQDRILERERKRLLYRTPYQRAALKNAYNIVMPMLFFSASAFALSRNINQALAIICFDLLSGIRIALPTLVLSYMYRAGKQGLLIKSGSALEELAKVDLVVFARTGVITSGESEVSRIMVLSDKYSENYLLERAAAVEYRYHHAAARAIYRQARLRQLRVPERKNSTLYPGRGISAEVEGSLVTIGNEALMQELAMDLSNAKNASEEISRSGDSLVYLALKNEVVAVICYKDKIRSEAGAALEALEKAGLKTFVFSSASRAVFSEDNENQTNDQLRLSPAQSFFELSPEDKADLVRDFQLKGLKVAFCGDDLSDALAMAQADIALAMSDSTELARYRADIIVTNNDLKQIPQAYMLAKDCMSHLKQNMLVVSLPNWLGLLLSVSNRVGPVGGAVLNNGSVILAALNGLSPAVPLQSSETESSKIEHKI